MSKFDFSLTCTAPRFVQLEVQKNGEQKSTLGSEVKIFKKLSE